MHLIKQCANQHSEIRAQHNAQIWEIAAARNNNKKSKSMYLALKGAKTIIIVKTMTIKEHMHFLIVVL